MEDFKLGNAYINFILENSSVAPSDDKVIEYSHQEKMCLLLLHRQGEQNMSQIAGFLMIPNSTANYLIKKLLRTEDIKTYKKETDKRVSWVDLTDKGHNTVQYLQRDVDVRIKKLIKSLEEIATNKLSEQDFIILKMLARKAFGEIFQ